jgi:hypothetical protein
MRTLLADAFAASGRIPDLVLIAHVHNYQRLLVPHNGGELTCIVAGNGGYPNLHNVAHVDGAPPLSRGRIPYVASRSQAKRRPAPAGLRFHSICRSSTPLMPRRCPYVCTVT